MQYILKLRRIDKKTIFFQNDKTCKMIKRGLFIFAFLFIPSLVFSQSVTSQLVSCFNHYQLNSVDLSSISSDKVSYHAGEIVKFKGLITNNNPYPVVDGMVLAQVIHLDSNKEGSSKNGDNVLDEFLVKNDINILAQGQYPLEFDYQISDNFPGGEYQLATYFISSKRFLMSGIPFLSNVPGASTRFSVNSIKNLSVYLDRNSVQINDSEYEFRNLPPTLNQNSIQIKAKLINKTKTQSEGKITFYLYKWDFLNEKNLLNVQTNPIVLIGNETQDILISYDNLAPDAYSLKIVSEFSSQKSILILRFAVKGVAGHSSFFALNNFPLKSKNLITPLICFHAVDEVFNGQVKIAAFNDSGKTIFQKEYEGKIYPNVFGVGGKFFPPEDAANITIKSEIFNDAGVLLDEVSIKYDCSSGKNIINKLDVQTSNGKISAFGLNWCNEKILTRFDNVVIKDVASGKIFFADNHLVSSQLEDIILPNGHYLIELKSGPFALTKSIIVVNTGSAGSFFNYLFYLILILAFIFVISTVLIYKKTKKRL